MEEYGIIDSKYIIKKKIGFGGQANVFLVEKIGTKKEYAAKVFKKNTEYIENEINLLQEVKQYQCPYIINIIDSGEGLVERKNRKTTRRKYFILENLKNGNLFDYVLSNENKLGELYSKIIFQKIIIGIQCLHKHNICHRDIKLSNILLDDNFNPKICDFGYACFNSSELTYIGGTEKFKPPEGDGVTKYDGIKGDIFYLASALMILTVRLRAFLDRDKDDNVFPYIKSGKKISYWKVLQSNIDGITLTDEFKDLLWKMLSYDPDKRLTIDEILAHSWFNQINKMKTNNLKEFKEKENEIKLLLSQFTNKTKETLEKEIKSEDKRSVNADYNNRGFSVEYEFFEPNVKPKLVDIPMDIKYCVDIKDYYLEPVKFMNRLLEKIVNIFELDRNLINASKEILKAETTFKKKRDNRDENDEEDEEDNLIIEIKLYKDFDKYILRFKLKKGDKLEFFEKYKIILDLIAKTLNEIN